MAPQYVPPPGTVAGPDVRKLTRRLPGAGGPAPSAVTSAYSADRRMSEPLP
ncbi:hypothetical protein [Catellatospora bangladeshensis]|uniref:hypothetical protein n=1 Tax=Catellatospora bangladeshensis TaxID=310355 RepID=UPI00194293F5|nr:hypothetical protein [Catellatospora bangladeshensis]